jgi:hypothetical protein
VRILRGLTSHVLPCGCVAGVYETYDGHVVTLLDERASACTITTHKDGNRIPDLEGVPSPSKVGFHSERQRQS